MKVFSHFKNHVSKFKSKLFLAVKSQNALKKFFSLSIKVLILVILTTGGFYLGLNFSVITPQLSSEKNSSSQDEIKQINIKASVDNDQVDTNPTSSTQDVPSSIENYDVSPLESPQKSEWISVGWEIQDGGNVRSIDNFKAKFANYEDSTVKAPIRLSDSKSKNVTTNPESASESLEIRNRGADYSGYKSIDDIKEVPGFSFKVFEATVSGSIQFSIEIEENGVMKDKINNIVAYAFSEDSSKLFLTVNENIGGEIVVKSIIKNIGINNDKVLRDIECLNKQPVWIKNNLITLNFIKQEEGGNPPEYNSDFCIFDENGNILSRIDANLETDTTNVESYGTLPNDSSIFYIFTRQNLKSQTATADLTCSLFLFDTKNVKGNLRYVDLVEINGASNLHSCSKILGSLDLRQLNFNSGKLAFRLRSDDGRFTPWVIIKNEI